MITHLRFDFLSDLSKGANSIDVFSIDNMWYIIDNNQRLSMDEAVQDVLLQSLMVIHDVLSLSDFEGVVAVREDDGRKLVLIVQKVTAVEVCDRNLVLTPERVARAKKDVQYINYI